MQREDGYGECSWQDSEVGLFAQSESKVTLSSQADVDAELKGWAELWEAEAAVDPLPSGRLLVPPGP